MARRAMTVAGPSPRTTITRRTFLRGLAFAGGSAAMAGGGLGGYAFLWEPNDLEVSQVDVALPSLPASFAGLRIAHLTDLHASPTVPVERLRAAVTAALTAQPDLVILTGDYVSSLAHGEDKVVADVLSTLRAPLGVYAVFGNHDHWSGPVEMVNSALRRAGVTVLTNEGVPLERGGEHLFLAGVDDVRQNKADLAAALRAAPAGGCIVLLAHEPDFADEVARDGRVTLQLSGHSHGGQVVLPFAGPIYLPYMARKYPRGYYRIGGLQLYTSRGIGTVHLPARFNCPPEIAVLELVPAPPKRNGAGRKI